jgi:SAM-dependent methyltransferase
MASETPAGPDAAYFDRWHADLAFSPGRDAIAARTLGVPPHLRSTGILTWAGLAELSGELRLPPDGRLLDIACGRGAYGVEVALRTGAHLTGVDFSAVALEQARRLGAARLPAGRSEFRLGTLVATGLPAGEADGLMCVDAVQFAEPPLAALTEFHRLLAPGGRLVLTCWEAVDPASAGVPARIRAVHLRRDLPRAGFVDVRVQERPEWRRAERAMWAEVVAATDPDPAVLTLRDEGLRSLETFDEMRRVVATATAP